MIEHPDRQPTWLIEGRHRRFVAVGPMDALERFLRSRIAILKLVATLEAIADRPHPVHPKLTKMKGEPNAVEFGPFGRKRQGRLYLYRTRLDGVDTFLICLFHQKKRNEVVRGVEARIREIAEAYLGERVQRNRR